MAAGERRISFLQGYDPRDATEGLLNKAHEVGREKWWKDGRVIEGEGLGSGFDQNTLKACIKFFNNERFLK